MGISVIVAPIFILLTLLVAVIPVAIGLYVFKDAKKRGMNAALWTLLSVLAPGFIGLIIYLIVRGEHPDMQCPACAKPVSADFAVCPYCGAPLKEKCANCGYTLEAGWEKCPSCGTDIPEEQRRSAVSTGSGKGLKKLLALIIIVPLVLMVLLFAATCLFTANSHISWMTSYDISKDELLDNENSRQILDWIEECDSKGQGVYVMRTDNRMGATAAANCLVYRNDGYFSTGLSPMTGGWFSSDELHINFYDIGEDIGRDYTLCLFEYGIDSDENPVIKVYEDNSNMPMDFTLTESELMDGLLSNYFDVDENENYYSVYLDESLSGVYHVEATIYCDGEELTSEMAQNADESEIKDEGFDFFTISEALPEDADCTLVFRLLDEYQDVIAETDHIPLSNSEPYATVIFSADGDTIKYEHKTTEE